MSPTKLIPMTRPGRRVAALAIVMLSGWTGSMSAGDAISQQAPPSVAATSANTTNESWRMQYHNNHWWYWQPSNGWLVYENKQWVPFNSQSTPQNLRYSTATGDGAVRYESGYRGVPNQTIPPATANRYARPTYRARSAEPSGGMNGQPNDPFIRGN